MTRFLEACENNLAYALCAFVAQAFLMFFPGMIAMMKKEDLNAPPCLLAIAIMFIALVIDTVLKYL